MKAEVVIQKGQLQGIRGKINRLEHLRSLISAEKKQLNKEQRAIPDRRDELPADL